MFKTLTGIARHSAILGGWLTPEPRRPRGWPLSQGCVMRGQDSRRPPMIAPDLF